MTNQKIIITDEMITKMQDLLSAFDFEEMSMKVCFISLCDIILINDDYAHNEYESYLYEISRNEEQDASYYHAYFLFYFLIDSHELSSTIINKLRDIFSECFAHYEDE